MSDETPQLAGDLNLLDASDDELDSLLGEVNQAYFAAASVAQMPSAISALNLKSRILSAKYSRAEARAKNQGELLNANPLDPTTWSPELSHWVRKYCDGILHRMRELEEANNGL